MTTGPGLIMPMATATRNSRSVSQPVCCTRPFSRNGTITSPLPNVIEPALRKNAVEDRRHPRQPPEVDVERVERRDDDDVRQDERPPAGPRAPEAAADVRNPNAHLDGVRAWEGLADGDALAHLVLREPAALLDELPLHLAAERDGPDKARETEPQIVSDELADGHALWRLLPFQSVILLGRSRAV